MESEYPIVITRPNTNKICILEKMTRRPSFQSDVGGCCCVVSVNNDDDDVVVAVDCV